MKDFYYEIKKAIEDNSMHNLIETFRADHTLTYIISTEPVFINPNAYFEPLNRYNSLESIAAKSKRGLPYKGGICLSAEIPFTLIFDPEKRYFKECFVGETGNKDFCSWDKGNLLSLSYEKANSLGMLISLAHTHPVIIPNKGKIRRYGAIPSCIPYINENEIKKYVENPEIANAIIKSRLYKRYGGDYCDIFVRAQKSSLVSDFSLIMSPALNQLGIFEIKDQGKVIYHPWKIGGN